MVAQANTRGPAKNDRTWPPTSLLGGLSQAKRHALLAAGTRVRYPAGKVLIREGEDSTFALFLLDGVVKVLGATGNGRDTLLAIRLGGDLIGELAALDSRPRSATVVTCGPVTAQLFSCAEFLGCLRDDPDLAHAVNRAVVGKLRMANERRISLTGCGVDTRVARVLWQVALSYGERNGRGAVIPLPLTQPELASLCDAAESTVHKSLRRLRESGVIATGYRSVTVTDLAALRDAAF
ncbi:Crp/Fnr family transcriptional regulator [Saccharomonospora sp. NB11]|uniref:Crp/Fnr family transcriptional regulator n=1 Tax=Saccharomonospora sp. NB11 TaxID=1642298 RepID=UPI0018D15000|nr:Crp/Fnr family transcriptional regulator [Saccharomonospora sp. NB11]